MLEPDEDELAPVIVWARHLDVFRVAIAMARQLSVGFDGPIGWRIEALPVVCRMLGVPLARQREIFRDLLLVEDHFIGALREACRD